MGRNVSYVRSILAGLPKFIVLSHNSVHVNHLSTALLSFLLLPNLVKAAEVHTSTSRIVITGSETHFWTKFDSDVINAEPGLLKKLSDKDYCTPQVMFNRYFDSKRA